jgi:hypothetical protein
MQFASLTIAPGTHRIQAYLDVYIVTVYADGSGRASLFGDDRLEPSRSLFSFDRYRFATDDNGQMILQFVGARFLGQDGATVISTEPLTRVAPADVR